ncbi:MAG: FliM/FliN family flagellar motor switch protein [Bacillota bacterium]
MTADTWDKNLNQGQPDIKKVVFKPLGESKPFSSVRGIAPEFHGVKLKVAAELGKVSLKVRDLINLEEGSVMQLNRVADEKVLILVNGVPFAHGEIVVINDRFGVRVTSLVDEEEEKQEPGDNSQSAPEEES